VDILLGLLLIVFGLSIAFMGAAVFFAILPMLGFVTGFFVGAALIQAIWSDGFLSTVAGWVVGFVFGVLFASVAYLWWYAGLLLAAGSLGALVGSGLARAMGQDSGTWHFLLALIGFIAFMAVAYVLKLPIYVLIVSTAVSGASLLVIGILLVFNRVDRADVAYGTASALIAESWWWTFMALMVAVVGAGAQLAMRERIRLPNEQWVSVNA
jgi:hypothetical protein